MEKFFCAELLLGKEKIRLLQDAFAVLIGLGAVGSYAAEALVRCGLGRIRLVDFDKIKTSNFNRHLAALDPNLGKPKVEALRDRITQINSHCKIEALEMFAAEETMGTVLGDEPDLVIDAVDSVNPKAQILEACYRNKIPVIASMGAALRTDIFSVKVGDLFKTKGCPLAREVRSKLRDKGIDRGIFCVYSDEHVAVKVQDQVPMINEEDDYERGRKRRKLGSLPTLPGIFGLTVAHYAIKYLTEGCF